MQKLTGFFPPSHGHTHQLKVLRHDLVLSVVATQNSVENKVIFYFLLSVYCHNYSINSNEFQLCFISTQDSPGSTED